MSGMQPAVADQYPKSVSKVEVLIKSNQCAFWGSRNAVCASLLASLSLLSCISMVCVFRHTQYV